MLKLIDMLEMKSPRRILLGIGVESGIGDSLYSYHCFAWLNMVEVHMAQNTTRKIVRALL